MSYKILVALFAVLGYASAQTKVKTTCLWDEPTPPSKEITTYETLFDQYLMQDACNSTSGTTCNQTSSTLEGAAYSAINICLGVTCLNDKACQSGYCNRFNASNITCDYASNKPNPSCNNSREFIISQPTYKDKNGEGKTVAVVEDWTYPSWNLCPTVACQKDSECYTNYCDDVFKQCQHYHCNRSESICNPDGTGCHEASKRCDGQKCYQTSQCYEGLCSIGTEGTYSGKCVPQGSIKCNSTSHYKSTKDCNEDDPSCLFWQTNLCNKVQCQNDENCHQETGKPQYCISNHCSYQQTPRRSRVWLIVLIIVLIALVAGGLYYYFVVRKRRMIRKALARNSDSLTQGLQ